MTLYKTAKETLTAVEMDCGDRLEFALRNGGVRRLEILETDAAILRTTLKTVKIEEPQGRTDYRFRCRLTVDGEPFTLEREVSTQRSFYEPWEIKGLRLWLDAVDDIFDFLTETHGPCRPKKKVRLAIQDADLRICPARVHPWCPLPEGGLKIEDCYNGEDCWLGAYFGASAHGGLDINHPAGTPLFAPIDLDDHYLYNSVQTGANNNRWNGFRRWPDGSVWTLRSAHMIRLTAPEHAPLTAGRPYAEGAGVWVGTHNHSHFGFSIKIDGDEILLDPWILFWQMYRDADTAPDRLDLPA